QFHTQQLTPFSRSRYYQLQFLKSSLQSNRHQTAESLANPESCKFNELLLSTLKVFPYFTIVMDTSGAEADGYFSTMYFCRSAESLANPESCKFNELLLSTLKVFPYFTIVMDTSGAEADGYFSTMYFC